MPEIASVLERPTILPANEEKPEVGQKLFSGRRAVAKGVLTRRHVFAAHGVFSYAKGNGRGVARVTVAGARPRQGSIRPRLRHRSVPSRPSRRTCIFLPSGHVCLLVKRGRSANLASGLAPTHTHTHTHIHCFSIWMQRQPRQTCNSWNGGMFAKRLRNGETQTRSDLDLLDFILDSLAPVRWKRKLKDLLNREARKEIRVFTTEERRKRMSEF